MAIPNERDGIICRFAGSPRLLTAVVIVLLLLPLAVSWPLVGPNAEPSFVLPRVHSGDEPHYLLLINSVIDDGDIDLANNYANVHRGGNDAGRKFARRALDHHVVWYHLERRYHWADAYEMEPDLWNHDPDGRPVPTLKAGFPAELTEAKEYSQHAPGLAYLLAPFLVPFRGTQLVECAALLATAIVTAAGFVVFCRFIQPYTSNSMETITIGAIAYLGSPLWHYGRTLFVEPYAATLVLGACAAILRSNRYWLGGLLLGLACLLKNPFVFICVPFVAEPLLRKDLANAIRVGLPVAVSIGMSLAWNKLMWHGWLHLPLLWEPGHPVRGMFSLLFSVEHGIVLFAPALLVACYCVPYWFRHHTRDAILVTFAFLLYFVHIGCYALWHGGYCYSARYMVPVLPLMFVPLGSLPRLEIWRSNQRFHWLAITLALVSLNFGVWAAFACENVWTKHPLQLMW